jgi:hypothetical protein
MTDEFQAALNAARQKGLTVARTKGTSVKALVARLIEGGTTGPVEILRGVLAERQALPGWLETAPDHEVDAVLSTWGSVKHAMAQIKGRK